MKMKSAYFSTNGLFGLDMVVVNGKFSSDGWQACVTLLLESGEKVTLNNPLTKEKFKNPKQKHNEVSMKRSKPRPPINLLFRPFSENSELLSRCAFVPQKNHL